MRRRGKRWRENGASSTKLRMGHGYEMRATVACRVPRNPQGVLHVVSPFTHRRLFLPVLQAFSGTRSWARATALTQIGETP